MGRKRTFAAATEGAMRCLPSAVVGGGAFADAACTQRLFPLALVGAEYATVSVLGTW